MEFLNSFDSAQQGDAVDHVSVFFQLAAPVKNHNAFLASLRYANDSLRSARHGTISQQRFYRAQPTTARGH